MWENIKKYDHKANSPAFLIEEVSNLQINLSVKNA